MWHVIPVGYVSDLIPFSVFTIITSGTRRRQYKSRRNSLLFLEVSEPADSHIEKNRFTCGAQSVRHIPSLLGFLSTKYWNHTNRILSKYDRRTMTRVFLQLSARLRTAILNCWEMAHVHLVSMSSSYIAANRGIENPHCKAPASFNCNFSIGGWNSVSERFAYHLWYRKATVTNNTGLGSMRCWAFLTGHLSILRIWHLTTSNDLVITKSQITEFVKTLPGSMYR